MKVLIGNEEWIEDGTAHAVMKLVRTMSCGVEHCRNHPVSSVIETKFRSTVLLNHCGKSSLTRALVTMDEDGASTLEPIGAWAFLHPSIVEMIAAKMKHLAGLDGNNAQTSVLQSACAVSLPAFVQGA
ncbi:putative retrotransposon hot spot protein 4 (RHS4) [Trypanosoma vivax]|nr:hypothetical protein TRVL_10402 [Trypanosoma vivax]KAH8617307.1 putative retrotransposon hot spot protein 4 (RHS4) [Trypanosoma vivax]